MGINGLKPLILKYAPQSIRCSGFTLKDLNGQLVAIDASIYMYKYLFSEVFGPGVSDIERIVISMCDDALFFMMKGITPVYIFDGKPPDNKVYTLTKRENCRDKYTQEISQLSDDNASMQERVDCKDILDRNNTRIMSLQKRSKRITPEIRDVIKCVFDLLGVPNIKADGEAEVLCAYLNKIGAVAACISNDTDLIALGAPLLILPFSRSKPVVTSYRYSDVLTGMKLTPAQFRDMCILCGCDYVPDVTCKIKGMGPIRAYTSILKYGSIEGVIKSIRQNPTTADIIPENFMSYTADARANFTDITYTNSDMLKAALKVNVNISALKTTLKDITNPRKLAKIIDTVEYLQSKKPTQAKTVKTVAQPAVIHQTQTQPVKTAPVISDKKSRLRMKSKALTDAKNNSKKALQKKEKKRALKKEMKSIK